MARNYGKSDSKEPYSKRRRGGRDKNATSPYEGEENKNIIDGEAESDDLGDKKPKHKLNHDNKDSIDFDLSKEKGADLQEEAGAGLAQKNRLKEKQDATTVGGELPSYGGYIKNRKKYNKHAAKIKQYASSYDDVVTTSPNASKVFQADKKADEPQGQSNYSSSDADNTEQPTGEAKISDETKLSEKAPKLQHEQKPSLKEESSRWGEVNKNEAKGVEQTKGISNKIEVSDDSEPISKPKSKLTAEKPKLNASTSTKLETKPSQKLINDAQATALKVEATEPIASSEEINSVEKNPQKEAIRKIQYSEAHPPDSKQTRHINSSKSQKSINYQHKLYDKADKLTEKSSKLYEKQVETIEVMPTKEVNATERVYDDDTGQMVKLKTKDKRTLHQNEARWNNPKFADKLKSAEGIKEKSVVVASSTAKKGAVLTAAATTGAIVGTGVAPAVITALVVKPTLKYGSKMIVNEAHRQVRKDIRQNGDNEVLKLAHWAEQKGERALGQGIRKLNPVAVRRYIKNAPYRRESKLQIKQLKNDRKLGLLRVKQDKVTGVNHMSGKKSNIATRAWQKRQIKRNYQKAIMAANGKGGGGTMSAIARELSRGNPKAILRMVAKKIAVVAVKFVAKITVLNPLFWKLMAIVLMFLFILMFVQACAAIFSPAMAGVGFVSDEDISFSTRAYSGWEVDMQLFLDELNIADEFPPPPHIINQPSVNGEVVYPLPPYTPPPPFYEYRFEVGMISHDPMELISYLTARHGERFDEGSATPMTRADLEAILAEIFEQQYGIAPGDFENLVHEETETRFRIERRVLTETRFDDYGQPYTHQEIVYEDIYYQFWILTVRLEPRSLSEVLRSRMDIYEQMHFDILNITGNGRQVVGNPFDFNWLPYITSHYGYRINPTGTGKQLHLGIDIGLPLGTPIFATHTGIITQVQFSNTGFGNMIRLNGEGSDGIIYDTLFAHLQDIHVVNGQEVVQGDLIATVGTSGDSTGPHLHLEVFRPSQQFNVGGVLTSLPAMHLNPLFAVITWTDDESNEAFRPAPGENGIAQNRPPFIPDIPPEAMNDARFAAILAEASRHLGARYVWGGAGPSTFDCSGFIHWVFSNALSDWTHGRTTAQGYFNMSTPVSQENARPGDLVFFHSTHSGAFITHVGIYVGNGQMIHTGGNPAGVEFVSINTPFWQRHFHAFARP